MDATKSTLDQLKPEQIATVAALTSEGLNRRRMMDMGILPGTKDSNRNEKPVR